MTETRGDSPDGMDRTASLHRVLGLTEVTAAGVGIIFLAVNATVIILRRTRPDLPRPFAVAGTVRGVPALPILGLLSVAVMMTQIEPLAIGLGVALCATGLGVGWLVRSLR
jgi:amino acid transporter